MKRELKQLFNFATSGANFLLNDSFYYQVDGESMGPPLGPVLTNLFMGYHEKKWLQEFKKERFLCIKVMLMIFFLCLEMKKMQKFF